MPLSKNNVAHRVRALSRFIEPEIINDYAGTTEIIRNHRLPVVKLHECTDCEDAVGRRRAHHPVARQGGKLAPIARSGAGLFEAHAGGGRAHAVSPPPARPRPPPPRPRTPTAS